MIKKTKINKEMIDEAYALARAGFNNKQLQEALSISKASIYRVKDLKDTIKEAR